MNRPIKFRAWDKLTAKFKYFDLLTASLYERTIRSYGVDVQQFTGILDKYNREIYEGDIVKFKWELYEHDIKEAIGEVHFDNGIFLFGRDHEFATNDGNFLYKTLEVMGNIFENPELISK